jgi:hypothetical protein
MDIVPILGAIAEALLNPPKELKSRFKVKALKQHIGTKGSRCDFFAENDSVVWSVRWIRNVPNRLPKEKVEGVYNYWEGEGNLWQQSKKSKNSFFLNTPSGLLFKTCIKIKDKRYLGSAGVQPKGNSKQEGAA